MDPKCAICGATVNETCDKAEHEYQEEKDLQAELEAQDKPIWMGCVWIEGTDPGDDEDAP